MTKRQRVLLALAAAVFALLIAVVFIYRQTGIKKNVKITYPDGYTVITPDNAASNEELANKLGYGAQSLEKYMNQRGIQSVAINGDNSRQMRLTCRQTDLSSELKDISSMPKRELETVAQKLIPNAPFETVTAGGKTYLRTQTEEKNDGGSYCSLQYVTISGGKYYCFNYYGSSAKLSAEEEQLALNVLATLKTPSDKLFKSGDTLRIVYITLITAVIITGLAAIILLCRSLARDFAARKAANDENDGHIKRRKR